MLLILREPESYMDEAATKKNQNYMGNYGKNYMFLRSINEDCIEQAQNLKKNVQNRNDDDDDDKNGHENYCMSVK